MANLIEEEAKRFEINKTFIVSLPSRLYDRLVPLTDYLKEIDFEYSIFEAVKDNDGKRGLLLSMEKLLTEFMYAEFNCVMVLEDDAEFICDNITEKIENCLSQLPTNFDLLYLGVNLFQNNIELFSDNLIKLQSGYATHAIIYSKSGIRKVLEAIRTKKHNRLPLDVIIVQQVQKDGNCYCSFPMLVSQKNGFSDIAGTEINYDNFLVDRFKERTAHLKKDFAEPK